MINQPENTNNITFNGAPKLTNSTTGHFVSKAPYLPAS